MSLSGNDSGADNCQHSTTKRRRTVRAIADGVNGIPATQMGMIEVEQEESVACVNSDQNS